jgi:hypothetical protein
VITNIHPGDFPEAIGIFNWLKSLLDLVGAIDVHTYAASGIQRGGAPEPYGSKLKKTGDAMSKVNRVSISASCMVAQIAFVLREVVCKTKT